MPPEYVKELLGKLAEVWGYSEIEITLEANPETRDVNRFAAFREGGINRLSIGAQSFDDEELRFLGRAHSSEGTLHAVRIAREAGFTNVSLDLMYGLPDQSLRNIEASLRQVISLGVEHISLYSLSIDEGTPFFRRVAKGQMPDTDGDLAADQYLMLANILRNAGFDHYELTNYCRPGMYSRHNSAYWDRTPYLGLGSGAHSFDGVRRFSNSRDARRHINRVETGETIEIESEHLAEEQVIEEMIYLGLRQARGVSVQEAAQYCRADQVALLFDAGFLVPTDFGWRVAEEKWLMLDEIVLRLLMKDSPTSL